MNIQAWERLQQNVPELCCGCTHARHVGSPIDQQDVDVRRRVGNEGGPKQVGLSKGSKYVSSISECEQGFT